MTIQLTWLQENILLAEFGQVNTWDEFHAGVRQMHQQAEQVEQTVYMIMVQASAPPPGHPLHHFQTIVKTQPANVGGVCVVPAHLSPTVFSFMKAIMGVVEKMNPTRSHLRLAASVDEAQQLIALMRATRV